MSQIYKWNVDKFCTYTTVLVLQLSDNGGDNDYCCDILYKILTYTPCSTFNPKIIVSKQVNLHNPDVGLLLVKTREEYHALEHGSSGVQILMSTRI